MPRTRSIAWSELKLGVAGLVAAALVTMLVFAVGGQGGFFWQRYPLKACFSAVQGLKTGAVVRLSGKEVGRVRSIEFAGHDVEVVMDVSNDVRRLVTTESMATIGSLSLLGEPIIDLTASDRGTPLEPWSYVQSGVGGGPFGTLTTTASDSLSEAGKLLSDLRAGRGTMGKIITDDRLYTDLRGFVDSASRVTRQINTGHGTVGELLRDPAAYNSLKASLQSLQEATDRLNRGEGSLGQLLNDDRFGKELTSTASHANAIADRLDRGEGTAGRLLTETELYDRINGLTERIGRITTDLDNGKGTAGRLLRDEQLYNNLNSAVAELRNLVTDIRKDPKKFLHLTFTLF
jgi:phospholipid/cholesterol/gamma-HCH transport system substrate-binding protein